MSLDPYTIPREKIAQLRGLLQHQQVDALLILSREASDPILPFLIGADTVHLAAAFFCKDGTNLMLTSKSDQKKFEESGIFAQVLTYDTSLEEEFPKLFARIAPQRLALNISENEAVCDGLTLGLYHTLEKLVGRETLERIEVSSEPIIKELRSVKTETEIGCLRRCIQITNDIYDEVFTRVTCGMTEIEIGDIFIDCMKKRGVCNGLGQPYDPPIVCIVRCGLAHRSPGHNRTQPGDILIMDFSVKSEGYISDIARTAYFLREGETTPPQEVQHAFDTAHRAISETIAFIAEGKKGYEVDAVGRRVVEQGGFPTVRHAVGHPIGRECHDCGTSLGLRRPGGNPSVERPIQRNEVYAIEPTVIQDGGLPCMLVEENVVIREDGAQLLSRRQDQLYLIESR